MAETTPELRPNPTDMRGQLNFMFGDAREYDDGLVEIAVDTIRGGWFARLFDMSELDAAVSFAIAENAKQQNIYVGAALRDPDSALNDRCADTDFYAATAFHCDLDDEVAVLKAVERTVHCKPHFAVCTGMVPARRMQLWWRALEPVTNPETYRNVLGGLADSLDGDRRVTNPGRVMRLAGSIAWPTKPGRVPEMTFIVNIKQPDPTPRAAEEFVRAYPTLNKVYTFDAGKNEPINRQGKTNSLGLDTGVLDDGRHAYMRSTVLAVLGEFVGTTGSAPDAKELFDLAWPQYSAHVDLARPGRGPDVMAKMCASTLRRFERGMLRGQRGAILTLESLVEDWKQREAKRVEAAKPQAPVTDPTPDRIFVPASEFAAAWRPADYIVDGLIQRGYCYSLTSPTGHGKTSVILNLAAMIGTGKTFAGCETAAGRVGYFAAENPNDVQARWIGMQGAMGFTDAAVWFCQDTIDLQTSFDKIAAEAEAAGGFDLIVVDTSQAFFRGDDENSNAQAVTHAKAMRRLTRLPGNPCVIILTHPVKNPSKENLLPRGGGGFLAEVDGNLTLWNDSDMMVLHHQGKLRGPGFAPINFMLRQVTSTRLADRKGRAIPTVMAEYISEEEYSRRLVENATDQDKVMILILSRKGKISVAEIARINGWVSSLGVPHKSKVARIVKKLKDDKLVTTKRNGRLALTHAGEREIGPKAKALGIDGAGEDNADEGDF